MTTPTYYANPYYANLYYANLRDGALGSLVRGLMDSGGVEGEGLDFGFGALGWDFFSIQEKADAGGVAYAGNDLALGAEGGLGGRDEGFLGNELTVGDNGNPAGFGGANYQRNGRPSFCRGRSLDVVECANSDVAFYDDVAILIVGGCVFGAFARGVLCRRRLSCALRSRGLGWLLNGRGWD